MTGLGYYEVKGNTPHMDNVTIQTFTTFEEAEQYKDDLEYNENNPDYGKYSNLYVNFNY